MEETVVEAIKRLEKELAELKSKLPKENPIREWDDAVQTGRMAMNDKPLFKGVTTDRNDPGLKVILPDGMQQKYLVLSEEERAKGFVRPLRRSYRHAACGTTTHMGLALSETYARNPKFYGGTYCVHCGTHFPLQKWNEGLGKFEPDFYWDEDGTPVGE